jgi:diaminopimelate decarboxylase
MISERDESLRRIAATHGTPCFVYFAGDIEDRIRLVRSAFDGLFEPSYAVKSNPHSAVLAIMRRTIGSLDISSIGEMYRGIAAGWSPADMSFTGPAKRPFELEEAVRNGVGLMVVESEGEITDLDRLAREAGRVQKILIRVAPATLPRGFGVSMSGRPSQFGIDEEQVPAALALAASRPGVRLVGFHAYAGTQCLNVEALVANLVQCADLFTRFSELAGIEPETLVFGSGFGIPYHEGMKPLDIAPVAAGIRDRFARLRSDPRFARTGLLLELGRFLVGEAGVFLTSVLRVKSSKGAVIGICDGGMNNHLGACGHLGSVIHRNYRMRNLSRTGERPGDGVTLVGPLCTSIDTLAHDADLPHPEPGDVLAIECSGAYGQTSSPAGFISHPIAREFLVSGERVEELPDESRLHERLAPERAR